jgi:hypothetical protein
LCAEAKCSQHVLRGVHAGVAAIVTNGELWCRFSLYELGGVVTNLLAGIAGSRWGIRSTLLIGLSLQIASIGMLYGWNVEWSKKEGIIYVTFAQLLAGVAKDLTKLGGKTVAKLVTPDEEQSFLFKLVSFITGALL